MPLPQEGDTVRAALREHGERRSRLAHGGAQTEMNTTKLIAHWSMGPDGCDVGARFRATDDIGAAIADRQQEPQPTIATTSFSIKGANEDEWQPLDA